MKIHIELSKYCIDPIQAKKDLKILHKIYLLIKK